MMDNSFEESALEIGPTKRKRKRNSHDISKCIICQKKSKLLPNLTKATELGISKIVSTAKVRQDEIYSYFLETLSDLDTTDTIQRELEDKIYYHRNCFATYTSKQNVQFRKTNDAEINTPIKDSAVPKTTIRSPRTEFNWQNCVICSQLKCKLNGEFKRHKFLTFERQNILQSAARIKNDDVLLLRVNCVDLIAQEAHYHHFCFNNYVREIQTSQNDDEHDSNIQQTFKILIQEMDEGLSEGKAYLMQELLLAFKAKQTSEHNSIQYTAQKLQRQLIKHYGNDISIINQRGAGMSNIIVSSKVTVSNAILAANKLKQRILYSNIELDLNNNNDTAGSTCTDDKEILHHAAGIIRKDIAETASPSDYPSTSDLDQDVASKQMPESLCNFVRWLLDAESFDAGTTETNKQTSISKDRKCYAITECIVACSKRIVTPLQIGLAAQLYHEHGSRNIIETLSSYGFCSSYPELRRFLSNLAIDESSRIQNGAYIPSNIIPLENGGNFVHEGDDNVDINTETIDGKNTFHSMARVVFQKQNVNQNFVSQRVKRERQYSLQPSQDITSLTQLMPFKKPNSRPEPPRYENANEKLQFWFDLDVPCTDMLWVLLRTLSRNILPLPNQIHHANTQVIPFWTGFNQKLYEKDTSFTAVAYVPVINAKPSDMTTIYTTMKKCNNMSASLGQEYTMQTMDQQLYAIAQQVKWSSGDEFDKHYIRLGGFHTLACFIAGIGKIWGDGGLKDILAESDVYAPCSVDKMLAGKEFHRSVRGLTLTYEALSEIWVDEFIKWSTQNGTLNVIPSDLWQKLADLQLSVSSEKLSSTALLNMTKDVETFMQKHLGEQMKKFNKESSTKSPTFKFWIQFLDAVSILLLNIRSERSGCWKQHIQSVCRMLPILFASNRINYSRWLPVYILEMLHLPEELKTVMESGQFTVRQASGKFNGIWSDMGTETTVIKDCKGQGGIVGITHQRSTLLRWGLTRHILSMYASKMRKRAGTDKVEVTGHEQCLPGAMKRDENHVNDISTYIRQNMTNPFKVTTDTVKLVNISTGLHASSVVQESIGKVMETGSFKAKFFVEKTFEGQCDTRSSLYDPISKSGLKTFTEMNKKTKLKAGGKTLHINISPELVFRRALTVANQREEITAKTLMSHPIGPVPISLFHEDGTFRKCSKAEMGKKLENQAETYTEIPKYDIKNTIIIRDIMAVIQSMNIDDCRTFECLAAKFLKVLCNCFKTAETVIDVYDRYDKSSLKNNERDRRSTGFETKKYNICDGRAIPPWKSFLSVNENKISLQNYFTSYVEQHINTHICDTPFKLYMAGGFREPEQVRYISNTQSINLTSMYSNQEEADTRMMLHLVHIDRDFEKHNQQGRVIIKSPDTDVLLLAMFYFPKLTNIEEVYIQTGTVTATKNLRRYIPIHELCKNLKPEVTDILPAVHALTGCDTNSSFFGIGKKSVIKTILNSKTKYSGLTSLSGDELDVSILHSRQLVLDLYSPKSTSPDLDALRLKLASDKDASLARLPPCERSFIEHVKRAAFQTKIWVNSHIANPNIGTPLGNGWKFDGEVLVPVYYEGMMASELIQDLICTCKKMKCSKDCPCSSQNLACTELCSCNTLECKNIHTHTNNDTHEGDVNDIEEDN